MTWKQTQVGIHARKKVIVILLWFKFWLVVFVQLFLHASSPGTNGFTDGCLIDCTWVRDSSWLPIHLGLIIKPFVPHVCSREPCDFAKVTDVPQVYTLKCPPAPEKRSPGARVWARPKPHIHRECGPRFPLPFHTSYTLDCPPTQVGEDVFSWCHVRREEPSQPWLESYWRTNI
jgi:hypothetical protein